MSNKIEFEYEWLKKFNIGLIKLGCSNYNKFLKIIDKIEIDNVYIVNTDCLNTKLIISYNIHDFNRVLDILNRTNEYDFILMHKELWEGISEGKNKIEYFNEICKKYNYEPKLASSCFLCEDAYEINGIGTEKNYCLKCRGKWFPMDNGICYKEEHSYFRLWFNESDPDLKKALAIKISKCADDEY